MKNRAQLKAVVITFLLAAFSTVSVLATDKYQFTIDLVHVQHDQVNVELIAPSLTENTIDYALPKIVPGTYAIYDFGRFIEDFHAQDITGNELKVSHPDTNTWTISDATKLHRITYKVNDTFDAWDMKDNPIFEPAGSNIEADSNYQVNTFAFIGYFQNHEQLPYEINIRHQPDFYGSTALSDEDKSNDNDRFTESNYHDVADNPMVYDRPDTATVQVGNCTVLISVYSPTKMIHASVLAKNLDTLLHAQGKYLGGTLPVNKYAFIIYTHTKPGISGGEGALEHSYCSVYYMPEFDEQQFAAVFRDFAAHEFFHILTPLTIHSEEIQYFDFSHPKMSEHLWLYEGTTEYHAHLVQEKYQLITPEEFLKVIEDKMSSAEFDYIDTLPFTIMSKGCLDQYKDQYTNVYQKGALIGMCIDIKLRALSNGKYGIQDLIRDLGKEYGKDKPFKDDELFAKIGQLTYPEITDFLKTYVAGPSPLPYEEVFSMVGVNYSAKTTHKDFSFGRIGLTNNPQTGRTVVNDLSTMNDFGKVLGYQVGDEIVSVNGTKIYSSNFTQVKNTWLGTVKEGDPIKIVVLRKKSGGKEKKVTLKAKVFKTDVAQYNILTFSENPTPQQLKTRNAWLNP